MVDTPSDSHIEKSVQRIGELHGNMAVLSRLDAVLRDANTDLSEPEHLIQSDGALSGTIIQLSNSPLYGLGDKSDNIANALQKVGFHQTLKLVGIALSKQVFMRDLESYGVTADSYWRYSYFTAVFLERQAKTLGLDADEAYLLGLLHSIGRVVINELLHLEEIQVYWDRFIPEHEWETMTIGFTNQRAGSMLLSIWDFPTKLCQRIENQNTSSAYASDPILSLLDYSRTLAKNSFDRKRLAALCKPGAHHAQKILRTSEDALKAEIVEIEAHVETVYTSLTSC